MFFQNCRNCRNCTVSQPSLSNLRLSLPLGLREICLHLLHLVPKLRPHPAPFELPLLAEFGASCVHLLSSQLPRSSQQLKDTSQQLTETSSNLAKINSPHLRPGMDVRAPPPPAPFLQSGASLYLEANYRQSIGEADRSAIASGPRPRGDQSWVLDGRVLSRLSSQLPRSSPQLNHLRI